MVALAIVAGFVILATLLYILWLKPEKSGQLTVVGVLMTFILGMLVTVLVPSFNENWSYSTSKDQAHYHLPYTAEQIEGRRIYQREGCMYCHSQQIRPLKPEMQRYSIGTSLAIPADEREYVYDQPHFLGTRRIGPDLSREGGKYSDDWHYSHFYFPRQMVTGSIMPAFTWLFDTKDPANPIPNDDARHLVAYVQTLGFERQVYDGSLNGGKGGWRPWLKAQDQQNSQAFGEGQVLRADVSAGGGKGGQVRGGDVVSPTNRIPSSPANRIPAPKP